MEGCSGMTPPSSPQFVVVDANVLIGLCAKEAGKIAAILAALRYYDTCGVLLYAPHMIVMEVLYVLCKQLHEGVLSASDHAIAVGELQLIMAGIYPPPSGDASLIARCEALRGGYGCSRSADSMYLALAEQLSALGPTELLTFDAGLKLQAAAMASTVNVNLLVAIPPAP